MSVWSLSPSGIFYFLGKIAQCWLEDWPLFCRETPVLSKCVSFSSGIKQTKKILLSVWECSVCKGFLLLSSSLLPINPPHRALCQTPNISVWKVLVSRTWRFLSGSHSLPSCWPGRMGWEWCRCSTPTALCVSDGRLKEMFSFYSLNCSVLLLRIFNMPLSQAHWNVGEKKLKVWSDDKRGGEKK